MARIADNGIKRRGSRRSVALWGTAALLLLLPLVAMQLTDEVAWDLADFVVFGAMLTVACGTYELAARRAGGSAYRAAVGVAVATAFFLVWSNLAVGIVGSEDHPANWMFYGVLAVGVLGALLARFRPRGMARALLATALAQVLVAGIVGLAGLAGWGPHWIVMGLFVALWLASAGLFRKAAGDRAPAGAAP